MTGGLIELTDAERVAIAREAVAYAGAGNPMHRQLHRDIDRAIVLAQCSPTFREIVAGIPQPRGAQAIVYVAGPMTGIPEHNVPAFDAARDALQAEGFATITPPDVTRQLGRFIPGIDPSGAITEEAYRELVKLDIAEMLRAGVVAFLPGWRKSRGARIEYVLAVHMGLDIWTVDGLLRACRGAGGQPDLGPGHAIIHVLTEGE